MRRRPAAPGVRPRREPYHGLCVVCAEPYSLDREQHPWSRARTCGSHCAKVLANRGRNASNCRHCDMVADYWAERLRQEIDRENGRNPDGSPGGWRDETLRLMTFREWLTHYPWGTEHEHAA